MIWGTISEVGGMGSDTDLTFCVQLDQKCIDCLRGKLLRPGGKAPTVPKFIHCEIIKFAHDSDDNPVFNGWGDSQLPLRVCPEYQSQKFFCWLVSHGQNPLPQIKVRVIGALVLDGENNGFGRLEIHPVSKIELIEGFDAHRETSYFPFVSAPSAPPPRRKVRRRRKRPVTA